MREETGQESANQAADCVNSECVQSVVVAEPLLELETEVDDGGADDSEAEGRCLVNEARGGRDEHQTSDRAAVFFFGLYGCIELLSCENVRSMREHGRKTVKMQSDAWKQVPLAYSELSCTSEAGARAYLTMPITPGFFLVMYSSKIQVKPAVDAQI